MPDSAQALTARQREFLAMSAQGKTYDQIAEACFVSVETVRGTLTKARQRLGAASTAQAVVIAIAREELGLTHEGITYVPIAPVIDDAA